VGFGESRQSWQRIGGGEVEPDALGEFMAWGVRPRDEDALPRGSHSSDREMVEIALDAPEFHPSNTGTSMHGSSRFKRKREWVEEVEGKIKECTDATGQRRASWARSSPVASTLP